MSTEESVSYGDDVITNAASNGGGAYSVRQKSSPPPPPPRNFSVFTEKNVEEEGDERDIRKKQVRQTLLKPSSGLLD